MEYVGGASGAVLGYITNNVPGAVAGWSLGRKYGKQYMNKLPKNNSMAPIPPKRRRSNPFVTPSRTPSTPNKRRRYSTGSMPRSIIKGRPMSVQGIGAGAVTVKGKRKRPVNYKKNVKVSKKLRDKIKKVITGQKIQGMTQENSYGVARLLTTEDFKQMVVDSTTSNAGGQNPYFSNVRVIDAASVLWNEKPQAETKAVGDARNFSPLKLKCKVIDSSVTYNFKNNTQRKITASLIECYPTSGSIQGDPFAIWQAALAYQKNVVDQGPNQSGAFVTELHTHPSMLPDFRKLFKTRTTRIDMPAGTEYKHYIQGPKQKVVDLQRQFNGSLFLNYRKECCWMLIVYHTDLVTTTTGAYGRFTGLPADQVQYGLVWETVTRWKLEMPEMAGTINSAAVIGDPIPLNQRQFSYAFKTYPNAEDGTIISINDENPAQNVTNP